MEKSNKFFVCIPPAKGSIRLGGNGFGIGRRIGEFGYR